MSDQKRDISIEDVVAWRKSLVTQEFMEYVQIAIEDCDRGVHINLDTDKLREAALDNAAMIKLKEVLDIPQNIIDDLNNPGEVDSDT